MKPDDAASSLYNDKDNDECKQVNMYITKRYRTRLWLVHDSLMSNTYELISPMQQVLSSNHIILIRSDK